MSIIKIAKEAGTSPATVSRVLNNPDYRCKDTELRDKIWKLAIKHNYLPNEAARSLKMGKAGKTEKNYYINVLMTRMDREQTDPFFAELLRVIESEIHRNNCILSGIWYRSLFSNDRKCRTENLDQIIDTMIQETDGKCDGLVVIGKCNQEALKKLNKRYKGVVSVNRNSTNYEVDEVLCDGSKIAQIAVDYLFSLGHQRIGYVGECQNETRYQGYLESFRKHNLTVEPDYVIETKQTEIAGFEVMQKLLQEKNRPTAIYCANDITAIGMLKCLNQFHNRYYRPSIISSDDIEEAENSKPMLTTVRLPKNEMGKFAMQLLVDRLKNGHSSVVRMELEGKLRIRSSCSAADDLNWSDYCI